MQPAYHRYRLLRLLLPFVIILLGCPTPPPDSLPPDGIPTPTAEPYVLERYTNFILLGDYRQLTPGTTASFVALVTDRFGENNRGQPLTVSLIDGDSGARRELFAGATDDSGAARIAFEVPTFESRDQLLLVESTTSEGEPIEYSETVVVAPRYDLLLSTDKPIYQPGQTLHVRALALGSMALAPADGQFFFLRLEDPDGNRIVDETLETSAYGTAALDIPIDAAAASGVYTLVATLDGVESRRTVEVEPYQLPRFAVDFATERDWYAPGEVITGTVSARYFFGKPVEEGTVTLTAYATDFERYELFTETGELDASGTFTFSAEVPDFVLDEARRDGQAQSVTLDVTLSVIDGANHEERVDKAITVADQPILVDAVAEAGTIRPGLDNIIYLNTTTPTGQPVAAALQIESSFSDFSAALTTDEAGLATITLPAEVSGERTILDVEATPLDGALRGGRGGEGDGDEGDEVATQRLFLVRNDTFGENRVDVLVRPERVTYAVGESMNVDILVAGDAERVFFDVAKGGQSFAFAQLPVTSGRAQLSVPLDGTLLGTLTLNAYVFNENSVVRSRRYVLVNPAPAAVTVRADADVYRPGETATLDVQVEQGDDSRGEAQPSMLGVSIVDESVFALRGALPAGFARTYFLLNRELLEPPYNLSGFDGFNGAESPYPADRSFQQAQIERALAGFFADELALAEGQPASASTVGPVASDWSTAPGDWAMRLGLALPLLGLALYDGSRRRRRAFVVLVLLGASSFVWSACAAPAVPALDSPASEADDMAVDAAQGETTATAGQAAETRLRQFFPETLFWLPELETDADGRAQIEVPIADSITSWRVNVVASDKQGNLGSARLDLRAFQPFFVEPDLPRFLTAGDAIAVPVSIFNYLDEPQTIEIALQAADWFAFATDDSATGAAPVENGTLSVEVAANDVSVAYVPIEVLAFGTHELRVNATGSAMSDAVLREVAVLPDGQPQSAAQSGVLAGEQAVDVTLAENALLTSAIPGTERVTLRLYPSAASQLVQGLDALLQQPYGCFEQTTSVNYLNVLLLDYLRTSDQLDRATEARAERLIDEGYQRLLTFEVDRGGDPSGGFSLYGDPPPVPELTAYGLRQFSDMQSVTYVDPLLLGRMANFLASVQEADGSWLLAPDYIDFGEGELREFQMVSTARVLWALVDAGYGESESAQRAADFLRQRLEETARESESIGEAAQPASPLPTSIVSVEVITSTVGATDILVSRTTRLADLDSYTLAFVANALHSVDPGDALMDELLTALLARTQVGERLTEPGTRQIYWRSDAVNFLGARGQSIDVETTALAAIALLNSEREPALAQGALDWLAAQRGVYGNFYSTQTTVLALRALQLGAEQSASEGTATVTVEQGARVVHTFTVDDDNSELVQQVVLVDGDERLIDMEQPFTLRIVDEQGGERRIDYQLAVESYAPWGDGQDVEADDAVAIDVRYDRTELVLNEIVTATAQIEVRGALTSSASGPVDSTSDALGENVDGGVGTLLVSLGLPPGFRPLTEDLDALIEAGAVDRYEVSPRAIVLYLSDVPAGERYAFDYRLRATLPMRAVSPSSLAYDYYVPEENDVEAPERIVVTLGTGE